MCARVSCMYLNMLLTARIFVACSWMLEQEWEKYWEMEQRAARFRDQPTFNLAPQLLEEFSFMNGDQLRRSDAFCVLQGW